MKNVKTLISLVILANLVAFQPVNAAEVAKKADKNIGLQLYSLRDDFKVDFDQTITAIGQMGYKFVEAASYNDGKFYGMNPKEFSKKVKKAGMIALSSHTNKPLPIDKMESINWDEIWQWWDQAIDAHKAAGMKYLIVPSMPKKFNDLKTLKAYCDYYNQIGQKCKDKGLRFGYHNHAFEFVKVEDQLMYDYMLQNTDPSLVFFQMDVYWVVKGGYSPVEYFEQYPGRFEVLHIKDHKELGESGMVGFDAIFKHIDKSGAKYLVVEVERYNYEPKVSVQKSLDYLLAAPFVKKDYSK